MAHGMEYALPSIVTACVAALMYPFLADAGHAHVGIGSSVLQDAMGAISLCGPATTSGPWPAGPAVHMVPSWLDGLVGNFTVSCEIASHCLMTPHSVSRSAQVVWPVLQK